MRPQNHLILDTVNGFVGRHSKAKCHRQAESSNTNIRKSVEAQDKTEYLSRRANSVVAVGIASDAPGVL
ncbi:DUF3560 domain-containing protein [Vibrio chagasii]|uniref:DUF3560 domain-containing protein n=1 Tax=Vibrio chagasii TaxID=170679 RepID=A0A7V7NSZ8_9VIBR|nr:DUF3560 domain-containing protein [Vibrio chagasii]KAB0479114.1 DUF3560 domain-containing protein [Vibrio chagasii]